MKNVVLGLKLEPYHDTGAAVVAEDGSSIRVVAISEERLDRCKNSRAFPAKSIAYCLDALGCRLNDVTLVVADYIERPAVADTRIGGPPPSEAKTAFFRQLASLGIRAVFAEHHLCHAASAYFATPWDEALAVVIDGEGSAHETQSIFRCEGSRMTKVATSRQPGIGWMYTTVTETLLGFDHLQEGKTMGLAGHARDGEAWREVFRHTRGAADNPCDYSYPQFLDTSTPNWRLRPPAPDMRWRGKADDPVSAPFAQYAYAAQAELEDTVMRLIEQAASLVPSRRLCYAGGVALNIPANRLILDSGLFNDIFIQPAASDAGIPLGAALLGYYTMLGGTRRWEMTDAFLARDYDADVVDAAVDQWRGAHAMTTTAAVASLLAYDYLVAWWQGAAEYGPRALGHRSILCSPRHPHMKAYLNDEVKHREMFRPFAPIVPIELQHEYFDLPVPSPFMLLNARVHPDKIALMPAAVHADGTARVQTIRREDQPELHALLHEVGHLTGVPVLVNTSLNLAGEPIVETPADVISLFERSRLDALVIGLHLLTKTPLSQMVSRHNPGLAVPTVAADLDLAEPLVAQLSARATRVASPLLPLEVEHRLRDGLAACGHTNVVVWGNGSHTQSLLPLLDRLGARVRCIVHNGASAGARNGHSGRMNHSPFPVISADSFTPAPNDMIVLSSETYERDMWTDLAPLRARGVPVLALYNPDLGCAQRVCSSVGRADQR